MVKPYQFQSKFSIRILFYNLSLRLYLESQIEHLLKEGIECHLIGDVDTGKAILRDYINATIGFDALGAVTAKSSKSLMRMFGSKGNPQARNIFEIIAHLQKKEGIQFKVQAVR